MKKMLPFKIACLFVIILNASVAQTANRKVGALEKIQDVKMDLWPTLLVILSILLGLSYLLTKAIDKRTNKP